MGPVLLKRILGLGSYETAWTWLHKLRRAMVRPGRERLNGTIEVDETYLGGLEEGLRGRQIEEKVLIVVAAQEDGKGIGRIRMKRIPDASSKNLHSFIEAFVETGSTLRTDGWSVTQDWQLKVISIKSSLSGKRNKQHLTFCLVFTVWFRCSNVG